MMGFFEMSTTENYGDHPRACGEKLAISMNSAFVQGSPLRMRGKDLLSTYNIYYNTKIRTCQEKKLFFIKISVLANF